MTSLQSRKRQLVRDAIYDAAIALFSQNGFDETTVEQIAEASGISRRSFFRYFGSKDDLLAQSIVDSGQILCQTVASCPPNLSLIEVLRQAVGAGVSFSETQPRTRQIIEIADRSPSARQAQYSRLLEQEDKLAAAFAARMKSASHHQLTPFLLAGLTWAVIKSASASWYQEEYEDVNIAVKSAFAVLTRLIQEDIPAALSTAPRPTACITKDRKRTCKKRPIGNR